MPREQCSHFWVCPRTEVKTRGQKRDSVLFLHYGGDRESSGACRFPGVRSLQQLSIDSCISLMKSVVDFGQIFHTGGGRRCEVRLRARSSWSSYGNSAAYFRLLTLCGSGRAGAGPKPTDFSWHYWLGRATQDLPKKVEKLKKVEVFDLSQSEPRCLRRVPGRSGQDHRCQHCVGPLLVGRHPDRPPDLQQRRPLP